MTVGNDERRFELSAKRRFENLIEVLSYLVSENVYGPVDRIARAASIDMVRLAVYDAIRYLSTDIREKKISLTIDENEISEFLDEIERRGIGIARRIAIEALSRGLKRSQLLSQEQQSSQAQTAGG